MNRRFFPIALIWITIALFWLAGCSAFGGAKSGAARRSTQKGLYGQVPATLRAPADDAADDLRRAKADLKLAGEEVKLASLQKEVAVLKKKRSDLKQRLAKTMVEKSNVTLDRKKREAVAQANLGDKADNIKRIASLKTKELRIESDAVKTRAAIATIDLELEKLNRKVSLQAERVERHRP